MVSEKSQPADDRAKDYTDHAHIFKEKTAVLDVHKCTNLAKFEGEVKYVSSWF